MSNTQYSTYYSNPSTISLRGSSRKEDAPSSLSLREDALTWFAQSVWSRWISARMCFAIVLYVFLERFLDPRLMLAELVVELAVATRAGAGSRAGSLGPIYAFHLQGALMLLLLVVNAGAAASRRRKNALCEAELCATANLASDLQAALADGRGRCPITHQLMRDPVRTCEWNASRPDCHVYERKAIEKWLRNKRTSPWTNLPLENITLEPCHVTRDLVERLLAAQPVALPPNRYLDRALELAAKWAVAIGCTLLSHSLFSIGIDADVVCNWGGTEGRRAIFEWTGTHRPSRSGCAMHAPAAVGPVFELLPGVKPLAFIRGPRGQLSSRRCECCNQHTPRGGEDLCDTVWRTFVGGTFPFGCNFFELAINKWRLFLLTVTITKFVQLQWLLDADPEWQARAHEYHYKCPVVEHVFGRFFCWSVYSGLP